jgi:undecaprenyl-diphosphatase
MMEHIVQIDQSIILWVSRLVGKNEALDRVMIVLASDYFIPVCISLILLFIWYMGKDFAERDHYQRAVVCAAISIGIVCLTVMASNSIWRHSHPFQDMPQLLDSVTNHIFYPIHDPAFPSNTSAVTFAAAAGVWQKDRKWGLIVLIPAILMPLAKVYAAVYYPSDILGGAILGILTAYFIGKVAMPLLQLPIAIALWGLRRARLG